MPFSKRKDLERAARLRQRGDELAGEGSLSEAAEAYEESIRLGEFDRSIYIKLVETYFNAYNPQEADATLQKLVDANPHDTQTYRDIIRICLSRGRKWGALHEAIERGLELETKDTNYYLVKSYCAHLKYMRADTGKGQPVLEETIEAAEKSIELDSTNADAYYLLAQGLSWKYFNFLDSRNPTTDEYDEVIRALEKSLELDPNSAHAQSFLGYTYFSAGRYEDAISSSERLLKLKRSDDSPPNAPWFLIAEAYAHPSRFQDTIDTMRQALERQGGGRLWLGGHRLSIATLKRVVESDTDLSRVRSACLFASYANALFSRTAYHWDSIQLTGTAFSRGMKLSTLASGGTRRRLLTRRTSLTLWKGGYIAAQERSI